jgi:Tfp pilus assembly protein FimT
LLELMVALVVVGLLAAMSSTVWSRLQRGTNGRGAAEELRDALALARSDATTRDHYSGFLLDTAGHRYLRFLDSTGSGTHDGSYTTGERILQPWTDLPKTALFARVRSSTSPIPVPRPCGTTGSVSSTVAVGPTYAIVFRPDGSSTASLDARIVPDPTRPDTFKLGVLPAMGLVSLAR